MSDLIVFSYLAKLQPTAGAICLPHCDSIEIAWANVQAGFANFTEQKDYQVWVDDTEYPIYASPFDELAIEDTDARAFILLEDLLEKIKTLELPKNCGLVLTGSWSESLKKLVQQQTGLTTIFSARFFSIISALSQWNESAASESKAWLWLSLHTGCALDQLNRNRENLACAVRSEGIYSTDCATAILLQPSEQANTYVAAADELYANDPLTNKPEALIQLFGNFAQAEQRTLVHSLPANKETAIELYKALQQQTPKAETQLDFLQTSKKEPIALATSLGDLGACTLPMLLLIQKNWPEQHLPIAIAHENSTRIVWSELAARKTITAEGR